VTVYEYSVVAVYVGYEYDTLEYAGKAQPPP
jgi:hypothetical protein